MQEGAILMGKKGGGSSWLTAVKRAFRSPSKDNSPENRTRTRPRLDHEQDHDEDKKKERRRWLFRKPTNQEPVITQQHTNSQLKAPTDGDGAGGGGGGPVTVEVAAPTARGGVEVGRFMRPTYHAREHYAAIVIQTAFRGYLARRALRALKGLVKLQALVRGHNVRRQAKMTLKCMQALVRVQARVLDQRMRLSQDGSSRKSTFSDTNSVLESRYLQDIYDRKSMCLSRSREGSSINADDWDDRPHTIEEVKAMLQQRKDAALRREKTMMSNAFSQHKILRAGRSPSLGTEDELQERPQWLDRWTTANTSRARASTDQRDPVKTVEIDTSSQPYSYLAPNFRRAYQNNHCHQHQRPSSPLYGSRAHQIAHLHQSSTTPSPAKSRPIQVRSASPRCVREDRSYCSSQTPSLRSNYYYSGTLRINASSSTSNHSTTLPNYMAATESAKARARSQSAPRQRPSTPERERVLIGSAKKRLSYPVPDPNYSVAGNMGYGGYAHGLKSPSFKSVSGSHLGGVEQQSNYSSCCAESLGGEISPSSTTDLRRWLR